MNIDKFDIETLIPPFKKNWNWKLKKNYKKEFTYLFINYYFPYLMKKMSKYRVSTKGIGLLDIGCGWGTMAIPFLVNSFAQNTWDNEASYLGIDIRGDAIEWLENAYQEFPLVKFQHHVADNRVDYIGSQFEGYSSLIESNGLEGRFQIKPEFSYSIQWSSSLFTHLTENACIEALMSVKKNARSKSLQINTWLIIDDESRYSMATGIADRKLGIDCGSYLTYSKENPLVCTAYKIEAIYEIYQKAGLEILEIDKGSWRGPAYSNQAMHNQDIIVSRII
jgi:hypothetical protein